MVMESQQWKYIVTVAITVTTAVALVAAYKYRSTYNSKRATNTNSSQDEQSAKNTLTKKNYNNNNNDNNNNTGLPQQQNRERTGAAFNPGLIISKGLSNKPSDLPTVAQMGTISLQTLNEYGCNNTDRLLLCVLGTVFDVTLKPDKYGPQGSYSDFAGHDITLCLGSGKLEVKWLDRFVAMSDKHLDGAKGWMEFYKGQYPVCGKLQNWNEDQTQWPSLTPEELEEINAECLLM